MGPLQKDWRMRLLAIPVIALVGATATWALGFVPLCVVIWTGAILVGVAGFLILTYQDSAIPELRFALFALAMMLMVIGFNKGFEHLYDFHRPHFGGGFFAILHELESL